MPHSHHHDGHSHDDYDDDRNDSDDEDDYEGEPWVCGYCGRAARGSDDECPGCGAPRPPEPHRPPPPEPAPAPVPQPAPAPAPPAAPAKRGSGCGCGCLALLLLVLAGFCYALHDGGGHQSAGAGAAAADSTTQVVVTHKEWTRSVTAEKRVEFDGPDGRETSFEDTTLTATSHNDLPPRWPKLRGRRLRETSREQTWTADFRRDVSFYTRRVSQPEYLQLEPGDTVAVVLDQGSIRRIMPHVRPGPAGGSIQPLSGNRPRG